MTQPNFIPDVNARLRELLEAMARAGAQARVTGEPHSVYAYEHAMVVQPVSQSSPAYEVMLVATVYPAGTVDHFIPEVVR
jgi:hypothetical protein